MASESPITEPLDPQPDNLSITPESVSVPLSSAAKSDFTATGSKETSVPVSFRPPEPSPTPPPPEPNVVVIPSHSRWFSWDKIHQSERRFLPEFFDGRSSSKNPDVYKYLRDSIIRIYRLNPSRRITFTQVRKVLVGDVGSIRRVFDFLEGWGLINYAGIGLKANSKGEDKENKVGSDSRGSPSAQKKHSLKKFCSGCKTVCSIACFVCDKFDLTLCARCYVRGNYRQGVSSSDFRRVEISEEIRTGWSDKETLHLLEAIMHYGDDWKKVAEHVGGRSEKECVDRFVKLPFGEQFVGHPDSEDADTNHQTEKHGDAGTEEDIPLSSPTKRSRLTPLSDSSNPIMAQAYFLSTLVGSDVAEAAAQAAVRALPEVDTKFMEEYHKARESLHKDYTKKSVEEARTLVNIMKDAVEEAQTLVKEEEQDVQRSIADIVGVQMKQVKEKIIKFEDTDLQMEKEWHQLQLIKDRLFADQLTLDFQRTSPSAMGAAAAPTLNA